MPAALGFSDHSGWAVMAAVRGDGRGGFDLLFRRRIQTCPPELPRQPYHAVAEQGAARSTIDLVRARAVELVSRAVESARVEAGEDLAVAAVAMGRTPIPGDIDRVLASHALLHAAEGEFYRDAICEGAAGAGLRIVRFLNREVRSEATAALGWPLETVEQRLAEFGRAAGRPWTKDEKDATAAAMLALATISSR